VVYSEGEQEQKKRNGCEEGDPEVEEEGEGRGDRRTTCRKKSTTPEEVLDQALIQAEVVAAAVEGGGQRAQLTPFDSIVIAIRTTLEFRSTR
jgi:predicted transposase YdaD